MKLAGDRYSLKFKPDYLLLKLTDSYQSVASWGGFFYSRNSIFLSGFLVKKKSEMLVWCKSRIFVAIAVFSKEKLLFLGVHSKVISLRSQLRLEPRPVWSPLGIEFIFFPRVSPTFCIGVIAPRTLNISRALFTLSVKDHVSQTQLLNERCIYFEYILQSGDKKLLNLQELKCIFF